MRLSFTIIITAIISINFGIKWNQEYIQIEQKAVTNSKVTVNQLEKTTGIIEKALKIAKAAIECPFTAETSLLSFSDSLISIVTDSSIKKDKLPEKEDFQRLYSRQSILTALHNTSDNLISCYYTSKNRFQLSYPVRHKSDYQPSAMTFSNLTETASHRNQSRTVIWTKPYINRSNKQLMITASIPIYSNNLFTGALSADISLGNLYSTVKTNSPSFRTAIITKDLKLMSYNKTEYNKTEYNKTEYNKTEYNKTEYNPTIAPPLLESIIPAKFINKEILLNYHPGNTPGWSFYSFPLPGNVYLLTYAPSKSIIIRASIKMIDDLLVVLAVALILIQLSIIIKKDARLKELALYDRLTNLPNSNLLFELLNTEIEICKRNGNSFSILFLDLNRFKSINDTYGHAAGDAVLREFAKRLTISIRSSDTSARLAGDEFIVILRNSSCDEASNEIPRLRNQLNKDVEWNTSTLTIETSIGSSTYPKDGHSIEEIIAVADKAMYRDKPDYSR